VSARACCACGPTTLELRPYGPGGALICFPCMKGDPTREREAEQQFSQCIEAAGASGARVLIGAECGPVPFLPTKGGAS
jgi:hypothetical protein